ncbi:unnamed protein product, partial [marine sediment metagenome]
EIFPFTPPGIFFFESPREEKALRGPQRHDPKDPKAIP